jgi:TRAP-type C4-dicarboxylate transport system permease small subunit
MRRIINFIDQITRKLLVFFFLALALGIFSNVLFRYVFSLPLLWTEEICTLLLVWIVFLGAADLQKKERHITIDTLYIRCSPRVRKTMEIAGQVLTMCILALLILSSVKAVKLQSRSTTMLLGMPVSVFGTAVLVSSVLMFLYTVLSLKKKLYDAFGGKNTRNESNVS